AHGAAPAWNEIPVPPWNEVRPREPRGILRDNGLVVVLQEDHELPLIDGVIRIRGGVRDDPPEKTGLALIYGEVWRTGGTASKSGDQLDDFLESRAARVETGAIEDSTTLSWSSLKDDFDQVFPVIVDVLENPEFRTDKLEL